MLTKGFEFAWSDFLHEFYHYRTTDFFAVPPPSTIPQGWRQVLAGAAEWLSKEFGLARPAWVDDPEFFLAELWDVWESINPALESTRADRVQRTPPEWLRRNVVFEARNLIVL